MSLILEALRKSEAERRRGESPDLRTELPPTSPARGIRTPRWTRAWTLAALGLLVAAIAWLAWLRPWSGAVPQETHAVQVPPAPSAPAASAPPRRATVIPADAGARQTTRRPAGAATPATPDASGMSPATPTSRQARAPAPAGAPEEPVAAAPSEPAGEDPRPASAGAGAAVSPPASGATALTLAELTPAQRGALPPLKVSMHMWSAEPSRRFVILDGRRMAEGDRAGAVVVDTIGRDDVLLDWDGTSIRLSLR